MLTKLLRLAEIKDIVISERIKVYEASFKFDMENAPNYNYFSNIINCISQRDNIKIILQDENERILDISSETTKEQYNEFLENTFIDGSIDVKLSINKKIEENRFSIYSYDEFARDILTLPIEDVMKVFSSLLNEVSNFLIFEVYSSIAVFSTKTMFFVPYNSQISNSDFDRKHRIEECKGTSYFYNFDTYEILPDDFNITINYENNPLTELFQKITMLLSINFIASSSSINGDELKGVINGQRTIEYCYNINNISSNQILYKIYNWIYTDGSSIDKAIIARNVISLHCKYVPIAKIDDKVMASIQSNYNLYLKDNVKDYLELKNKVAEFICGIVSKTGEYAIGLLDKFKSNLIAIFGFIFSVILANIVSNQPLDNIFTKDVTILVECVFIGSFVYLCTCYCQSHYEIKKVYESYEQLKLNYKDILTENDLLEIFGNDEIMNRMKRTINKSRIIYLVIWIVFLIVALIIVEFLSSYPTYKMIRKALCLLIQK